MVSISSLNSSKSFLILPISFLNRLRIFIRDLVSSGVKPSVFQAFIVDLVSFNYVFSFPIASYKSFYSLDLELEAKIAMKCSKSTGYTKALA